MSGNAFVIAEVLFMFEVFTVFEAFNVFDCSNVQTVHTFRA
jgi:hypothetical protein